MRMFYLTGIFIRYTAPGARPTNDILVNQIRNCMKFCNVLFHNILGKSQPHKHYSDVCKISLWLVEHILNQSTTNFYEISNSVEITLVERVPAFQGLAL